MSKTNWCVTTTALAILAIGIVSVPAAAAVGQPALRPAADASHLVLATAKKKKPGQTQGQRIDRQLTQSGYKQQIQQFMGQNNYQQMIGGQGIPGQ